MTLSGLYYAASHGETFDSIAFAVYGDENYARELLEANPQLAHILVFDGGEQVLLPVIDVEDENDTIPQTAPWRR